MSLKAQGFPALPMDTARVARRAFRKGNVYLTIGDEIGDIFEDGDFEDLYALEGAPALSPSQLILVLIFQAMEDLSDRETADAVRARIDWKYALHLSLEDTGFDYSVLSEFRDRLIRHQAGQRVLDQVLERLGAMGLLKKRGRQRTDSSYVLSVARTLNRLELVMETMRLALEAVAQLAPAWLREIALDHWAERYSLVWHSKRWPKSKEKRTELAASVGQDGAYLLQAARQIEAPEGVKQLSALIWLEKVWDQQYEPGPEGWHWRPTGSLPPGAELIATPNDPEARYAERPGTSWVGYQMHFTETCDAGYPRLITHVEVVPAPQPDVTVLQSIHQALARRHSQPSKHVVDGGYMNAHLLVESRERYGIELLGPIERNTTWQAKQPDAFTTDMFEIDPGQRRAICPAGQVSSQWSESYDRGHSVIHIRFPAARCRACASRSRCTRSKSGRSLKLRQHFAAITEARSHQQSQAFREEYAHRAGIEGTISEAVRKHGARRSRYIGLDKTWLQRILLAAAINLERTARWLTGDRPATTRVSHLSIALASI